MLIVCKTRKARSCPSTEPSHSPPPLPPPPPAPIFFFFFLLFEKKIVAVENKYPVLGLPGNKFSGRACDQNK